VQKYLSVTNHAYTPFLVLYSKGLWDKLSSDEQKALTDCAAVGRDEQRKVSRELSTRSLENIRKAGMQVNELAPAEIARMRDAVKPVYERHAATIGPETVAKMQEALDKVRKQ
jgi:TRAP-type C4-dicarboxylate transport system substrate-binding protein